MVGPVVRETSEPKLLKVRGLYTIIDAEEGQWRSKKQQLNKLSSLSLFDEQKNDAELNVIGEKETDQDRPTTPINEVVKNAPKTYAGLSNLIYHRITPRPEWKHISEKDQSSLGAVIIGEVNGVWPLLRHQVDDPFLTHQQNRELQRRITIHCVTVCEQLFIHYVEKVKILNSRGVFSGPANMSRIRAQLALDTGKYLNILSVRRHIISDLKKPPAKAQITFSREDVTGAKVIPSSTQTSTQLSFRKLVKSSRPKQKLKYRFNLAAEVQSMQSLMPTLSFGKVHRVLSNMDRSYALQQDEEQREENVTEGTVDGDGNDKEPEEFLQKETDDEDYISVSTFPRPPKHRWPSEPMPVIKSLLEELKQRQKEDEEFLRSPSLNPQSRLGAPTVGTPFPQAESHVKASSSLGLSKVLPPEVVQCDPKDPREDLKMLVAKQEKDRERDKQMMESDDLSYDLPPLIQALTRREAQNENLRRLRQNQEDLDAKYKQDMREKRKPLPAPQFPQPPVMQSKLPGVSNPVNKSPVTIRASDAKINDRVDLSAVTLQSYLPVYNDLTGDISQATVKELDANLFQGGELREVYSEIMKTVPNLHQQYDNDPLVVMPGSNVDLSRILASSTLIRPRSQQVINPRLRRDNHDMPWNGQQIALTRTHLGYPASEATTVSQGQGYSAFHRFTPSQLHHPGVEKGSRAYASWLQWWKNSINTDDFFKYLSTQDTDFLSVIFHFFDSDGADSEIESMMTAKLEAQREREKKLAALKKEKEEVFPGLWNVKAVLLGGLGKDPEIEEDEEPSEFETPRSTPRSQSFSPVNSDRFEGIAPSSCSRKEFGQLPTSFYMVPKNATIHPVSKSSLEETDSTASVLFWGEKFGLDSSVSTSSVALLRSVDSDKSSVIDISDESSIDQQEEHAISNISLTSFYEIDSKRVTQRRQVNSKSARSLLLTNSLKLHDQLISTVEKQWKAKSSSSRCENISRSSPSISAENIVLKKNQACFGRSMENFQAALAAEEGSTSGYFSTSGEQAIKQNELELKGIHQHTYDSKKSFKTQAVEESTSIRIGSQMVGGEEGLKNRPITITIRSNGQSLPTASRDVTVAERRIREKIFRSETENTTDFFARLDTCARLVKGVADKIRSGSMNKMMALSSNSQVNSSTKETVKQDSPHQATIQERLEVVWHKLRMPESQKLDCALKYSTDKYIRRLPDIVSSWERAMSLILQREKMMISLEIFEKEASDPNRFFERGHRGSSVTRLFEAKMRANFYKKLETIEITLKAALLSIKCTFSDTVTFNGRSYVDKMEWDKIEMLFYLQQERRCVMLKNQGHSEPRGQIRLTSNLPSTRYTQLPAHSVNLPVPE